MTAWLLLIGAILSEVTATLSLRGALDNPALYVLVVAGYVLADVRGGDATERLRTAVSYGSAAAGLPELRRAIAEVRR